MTREQAVADAFLNALGLLFPPWTGGSVPVRYNDVAHATHLRRLREQAAGAEYFQGFVFTSEKKGVRYSA